MLVSLDNVIKAYPGDAGDVRVLAGVSLTLDHGQTLALTGESGSGKSTLLHLVGGLDAADAGRIVVNGVDLLGAGDAARAELRRLTIGIIFQQFNLIPSLTTADNLAFQARLAGRHDKAWLDEVATRLGLSEHLGKYPEELSGGQQQRVAVGRALASRPSLLLADEPTGNLDEATGDAVLDLMMGLVRDTGSALLMVTHSERLATLCDGRRHLSAGQLT
ncbi:MAG: ABC transporter ATP-binding protein [Pseudomonadota bacterium]